MKKRSLFAQRIRYARKRMGYTQAKLAEKMDVSMMSVHYWENDHSLPSTEKLPDLAFYLDVSLDWLMGCKRKNKHEGEKICLKR